MAPEVADRFEALEASGRLVTEANAIVSVEPHGERARVFLRTPGANELDAVEVDRVINCSGAGLRPAPAGAAGPRRACSPPGAPRPDELGLGLDVSEDGAAARRRGRRLGAHLRVGSLRKGVEWEAIGITEIRDHSGAVARKIVRTGETEEMPLPTELRATAVGRRARPSGRPHDDPARPSPLDPIGSTR